MTEILGPKVVREDAGTGPDDTRLTVDELARVIGMSPRTIRAHQARKLLPPPVREGRVAYYHGGHLKRLDAIRSLQRQGFNLVAIDAILGVRAPEPGTEALARTVTRIAGEHPYLAHGLARHGMVVRVSDQSLRVVRPALLRCALDLLRSGVQPAAALQLLIEVLDRIRSIADGLVLSTGTRVLALAPDLARASDGSWEELDRDVVVLAQGLVALLSEAFRVSVEHSGQVLVPDLVADSGALELLPHDAAAVDTG